MATAIVEYSPTEAALADLRQKYGATTWDVGTTPKMALAKKARAEIREWRISLESERKRIKAPALERCKAIDTEAKRITAELEKLEEPVDAAIKAEEYRQKEERERKAKEEAERVKSAQQDISEIRDVAIRMVGSSSVCIEGEIDRLDALDVSRPDEFASVALIAKTETIAKLHELHTASCAHEDEQAKVAAERAELARLRAEQEARRVEEECRRIAAEEETRAKLEAEQKAARERIADEERQARVARETADSEARVLRAKAGEEARRLQEIERDRLRDERARVADEERQSKAAREAADAESKAAREKADAEYRQAMEAEEAKLRAERDRIDAAKRDEQARKLAERELAEATEREKLRRAAERLDATEMLNTFMIRFGHLEEFHSVTMAISEFMHPSDAKCTRPGGQISVE